MYQKGSSSERSEYGGVNRRSIPPIPFINDSSFPRNVLPRPPLPPLPPAAVPTIIQRQLPNTRKERANLFPPFKTIPPPPLPLRGVTTSSKLVYTSEKERCNQLEEDARVEKAIELEKLTAMNYRPTNLQIRVDFQGDFKTTELGPRSRVITKTKESRGLEYLFAGHTLTNPYRNKPTNIVAFRSEERMIPAVGSIWHLPITKLRQPTFKSNIENPNYIMENVQRKGIESIQRALVDRETDKLRAINLMLSENQKRRKRNDIHVSNLSSKRFKPPKPHAPLEPADNLFAKSVKIHSKVRHTTSTSVGNSSETNCKQLERKIEEYDPENPGIGYLATTVPLDRLSETANTSGQIPSPPATPRPRSPDPEDIY
ncbi:unnamed protein product [Orchesella dallaii]|uniref:Uncharacterized protein n=1 Tax=Orchesella dallaii TaxID=48710 RepID=A0ABP1RPD3_9HEXA